MRFQVYNKKTGEKVEAKEIWKTTPPCLHLPRRAWFYVDEFGDLEIMADLSGLNECQAVDMDLYDVRFPEHEKLKKLLMEVEEIMCGSRGVDGWHLNGDIASWDEFDDIRERVLEAMR